MSNSFKRLLFYKVELGRDSFFILFGKSADHNRYYMILRAQNKAFIPLEKSTTVKKATGQLAISLCRRYQKREAAYKQQLTSLEQTLLRNPKIRRKKDVKKEKN